MESLKDHFKFGDVVGFNNGVRIVFEPCLKFSSVALLAVKYMKE